MCALYSISLPPHLESTSVIDLLSLQPRLFFARDGGVKGPLFGRGRPQSDGLGLRLGKISCKATTYGKKSIYFPSLYILLCSFYGLPTRVCTNSRSPRGCTVPSSTPSLLAIDWRRRLTKIWTGDQSAAYASRDCRCLRVAKRGISLCYLEPCMQHFPVCLIYSSPIS